MTDGPSSSREEALDLCMAQRDNMRAIFDSVEDGIFTVGSDLRISNANSAFLRLMGEDQGDAVGREPDGIFNLHAGSVHEILEETLRGTRTRAREVEISSSKGDKLRALLSSAPLRDRDQQIRGAVVVLHDVTRLRDLEDTVKRAYGRGRLVGNNVRMREIYQLIDHLADNDVTVLITGESGTGKELVAAAIHEASHRSAGPFVAINCGALSETLLESELFGHVKGAFTGAITDRMGRFEAANGGTIFLDEIGAVSEVVQRRLLRVLQEREFSRVGDNRAIAVDVRVLAATNADLQHMVADGRFREDLFYRLNVMHLRVPALRERREDIPAIAEDLLQRHAERMGRSARGFSTDALGALMAHNWDGNVRQLENAIQRALVVCRGRVIQESHLPPEILDASRRRAAPPYRRQQTAADEFDRLRRVLDEAGGQVGRAAQILGIHRTTLWRRLKKYGLHA